MMRSSHLCLIGILTLLITIFTSCKSNPDEIRYSNEELDNAFEIASETEGLWSLLVQFEGELIREAYYSSKNDNTLFHIRSITKSIISALIGIAIDRGEISNTDVRLVDALQSVPYAYDESKGTITLEHILTMSSGLEWNEMGGNEYSMWMNSNNKITYVIDKPMIYNPGQQFTYNSGTSHLLSVILSEATGVNTLDYAHEYLFGPINITNVAWQNIGSENYYYNGGSGLMMTSRDLLKIGECYLAGGLFNSERIISQDWVNRSTEPHIQTGRTFYGSNYGYLWWIEQIDNKDCFYGMGYGGQFLFVIPEIDLIIVAISDSSTGGNFADQQWIRVFDLIAEKVISAFH
jgi:CubicO group peptidase (beta-lactamase class C family)